MVNDYLPLNHADFHIMLSLGDDERHGYAVNQTPACFRND
jgi:hypothetical protein